MIAAPTQQCDVVLLIAEQLERGPRLIELRIELARDNVQCLRGNLGHQPTLIEAARWAAVAIARCRDSLHTPLCGRPPCTIGIMSIPAVEGFVAVQATDFFLGSG